eukprot:17481-Pelagococcus_subviridis.AAC.2
MATLIASLVSSVTTWISCTCRPARARRLYPSSTLALVSHSSRVVPSFKATSGRRRKASEAELKGVEARRSGLKPARGSERRVTTACRGIKKVLKDRRSPRERNRAGTGAVLS